MLIFDVANIYTLVWMGLGTSTWGVWYGVKFNVRFWVKVGYGGRPGVTLNLDRVNSYRLSVTCCFVTRLWRKKRTFFILSTFHNLVLRLDFYTNWLYIVMHDIDLGFTCRDGHFGASHDMVYSKKLKFSNLFYSV